MVPDTSAQGAKNCGKMTLTSPRWLHVLCITKNKRTINPSLITCFLFGFAEQETTNTMTIRADKATRETLDGAIFLQQVVLIRVASGFSGISVPRPSGWILCQYIGLSPVPILWILSLSRSFSLSLSFSAST